MSFPTMRQQLHNRRQKNRSMGDGFFSGMPTFFKLWFAFVFFVIVSIMAVQIFIGVQIFSMAGDPEAMGGYFGQVMKGFNEASK